MTIEEAIKEIEDSGKMLGMGDYVNLDALKVAVEVMKDYQRIRRSCMRIVEEKFGKCSCGANLAYTEDDIHKNAGDEFIICPKCQTRLYINSYTPPFICEECGKEFETETYIGEDGAEFAICPHCNEVTFVGDGIKLNESNVCYPKHFFQYAGKHTKAMSDEETTKYVRECISKIDKDTDYYIIGSGDTICFAAKSDEDLHEVTCYVCKKYSECHVEIPEEKF